MICQTNQEKSKEAQEHKLIKNKNRKVIQTFKNNIAHNSS